MTNDLLDCLGNGLVIGANGITLDLGGHTIDGTGLGVGIVNNGFDSVTITNGIVQEFDFGVQLNDGTATNIVSNMTLQPTRKRRSTSWTPTTGRTATRSATTRSSTTHWASGSPRAHSTRSCAATR